MSPARTGQGNAKTITVETEGITLRASRHALDGFYRWMAERHDIHLRRRDNQPPPWTDDPIFQRTSFCNVFRIYDRTTQYIINHVIGPESRHLSPAELVFRIILFRVFNRPSTWELLQSKAGPINLDNFNRSKCDRVLRKESEAKRPLYRGAYIIPSPAIVKGLAYENHLLLLELLVSDGVPHQIAEFEHISDAYELLKMYPGFGKFLSYQLCLDINMIQGMFWDENTLVSYGPGSKSGVEWIFEGPLKPKDIGAAIRYLHESQEEHWARLGITKVPSVDRLTHRSHPAIPDIEHSLCEYAKYLRLVASKPRPCGHFETAKYSADCTPVTYDLPLKWQSQLIHSNSATPSILADTQFEGGQDEIDYEVSHIVNERFSSSLQLAEYRVRWVGYKAHDDTWLTADELRDAQQVLGDWKKKQMQTSYRNYARRRSVRIRSQVRGVEGSR